MTRRELRTQNHAGGRNNIEGVSRRSQRQSRGGAAAPILPKPVRQALVGGGLVAALVAGGVVAYPHLKPADATAALTTTDAVAAFEDAVYPGSPYGEPATTSSRDYVRELLLEEDAVSFSVSVDGQQIDITSGAPTLAQALLREGIVVGWDDVVSAPMNEQATEGAEITIARSESSIVTVTEEIKHETIRKETASLLKGTEKVQTKGQDGLRTISYRATVIDGEEVARELITEVLDQEPVTEVILVGTKAPVVTASGGGGSSSTSKDSGTPVKMTYSAGSNKAIGQQMVAARGWSQDQWVCLEKLWTRESNWNHLARNPSSGAYGIPQSLPGTKMASAGSDWRTNPATQIKWGLSYIAGRYGTPCGALNHSYARGWY